MLKISLLGSLQITNDRLPVDGLHGQRVKSILTYLLLHTDTDVLRSELAGNLWPDISESQARTNLRRELHALKRTHRVIDACIASSKNTVTWLMPSACSYDVGAFIELCRAFDAEPDNKKKIELGLQAVALYKGQLVPGIDDSWIFNSRASLHQQWTLLSDRLLEVLQDSGESEHVVDIATRQLTFDPYLETAYAALMDAHIVSGNPAMALHAYHQCASVLEKDLDTSPNQQIQDLHSKVISTNSTTHAAVDKRRNSPSKKQQSDLIGRSSALRGLIDSLSSPPAKLPPFAFISGESGIGKSRLADEVLSSERLKHLVKVRAACRPARIDTAFGPFKDWILNPYFWNACKNAMEFEYEEIQSIFSEKSSSFSTKKLRKLRSQEEILSALSSIVCTVAEFYHTEEHANLLLYVDDLQWADAEFFSWLQYFLSNQNDSQVIFLCTARSEEMDVKNKLSELIKDLSSSEQLLLSELSYLNESDSLELMKKHIPDQTQIDIKQNDLEKIYGHLQGNPLFLIESVDHLLNKRESIASDKQVDIEGAPKIYVMLKRRIDLLDEEARQILLQASVIQRQFSLPLIQVLTDFSDRILLVALDDLWKRNMLREVNQGEYDFSHDSLRETCYASLSEPQKKIIHSQVARALEKLHPNQVAAIAAEIGVHYQKAGNLSTALSWFERALAHSRETLAAYNSIEYAERCLQLIDTTRPVVEIAERQVNILASLSTGYALTEGFGSKSLLPICKKMEELLPYVKDPETRWQAVNRLRLTATFSCQTYSALHLTKLQLSVADETGSVTRIIEAHRSRAFVLYQLGRLIESLSYLDTGLKIARKAEEEGLLDRYRPSWSLAMLVKIRIQILFLIGRFNDSIDEIQKDNNLESVIGDPHVRSMVNLWSGKNHYMRNRPEDALLVGREMKKVGLEERVMQIQCLGQFFCDWAAWKKGDTKAAIDGLLLTIKTYQSIDENILLPWWYHTLAEMQSSIELFDEALENTSIAIQSARDTRNFNRNPEIYRIRANVIAQLNFAEKEVLRLYDLGIKASIKQSSMVGAINGLTDKVVFLRARELSSEVEMKQLSDILNRVQNSNDFERLSIAKSLLGESA